MTDPEPDWDMILEQRAKAERDHYFPIADEEVTFAVDGSPSTPLTDWDW